MFRTKNIIEHMFFFHFLRGVLKYDLFGFIIRFHLVLFLLLLKHCIDHLLNYENYKIISIIIYLEGLKLKITFQFLKLIKHT